MSGIPGSDSKTTALFLCLRTGLGGLMARLGVEPVTTCTIHFSQWSISAAGVNLVHANLALTPTVLMTLGRQWKTQTNMGNALLCSFWKCFHFETWFCLPFVRAL